MEDIVLTVIKYSEEHSDDRVTLRLYNELSSHNDYSINEKEKIVEALFRLLDIK